MEFSLTISIQQHSQFTKSHLVREPLVDLTSEEIVDCLKALKWQCLDD